jgi:hypothetical protein
MLVQLSPFSSLGDRKGYAVNATPKPLHPQYLLHRRLGENPRPVWICMENLDPPGLKLQTVQPVICHYIDYTIPVSQYTRNLNNNWNV